MKKLTNVIAFAMTLALLAGLCTFTASAAGIDRATFDDVIRETALAYYNKGMVVQYDSTSWTIQKRTAGYGGPCRLTTGEAPEEGSLDRWLYSVCSDYCFTVYKTAFGYELMGSMFKTPTNTMFTALTSLPWVAYKYDAKGEDPGAMTDLETAFRTVRPNLKVGDVIVGVRDGDGHAMLYIGDYKGDGHDYIIHCWGGKWDSTTGRDKIETKVTNANPEGGAIRIDDVDEAVFPPASVTTGSMNLRNEKSYGKGFIVLRPYDDPEFQKLTLTDVSAARLKYRGIEIDKAVEGTRYHSPVTGGDLQLTVAVTNNGKAAYSGLAVTDPLPTGAKLKDAGGGKEEGGKLSWTVDVPAGETVKLTYTVTVTAPRGGTVEFARGDVGGIPTRTFKLKVGGKKLSADAVDKAERLAMELTDINAADFTGQTDAIEFANNVYKKILGVELNLPTGFNNYLKGICTQTKVLGASDKYNGKMWMPKKDGVSAEWQTVRDMLILEHLTGFAVYLGDDPTQPRDTWVANDRVQEYKEEYYEIGDVFLVLKDPDVLQLTDQNNLGVYVYLGDGKVAAYDAEKGVSVEEFEDTVACMISQNVIFGLRPTQAYDDINAGPNVKLPFTDVTEADWFYTYVKDLYNDGTVNGMTATTFVPKGNLTYGQALKLIVCALGHGEQASTAGHWASGYLKFAQDKGWITGNVDLNGNVTRLAFCQIAAKAKNLTEQPATNPFKDTNDAAVLALNKAGVINGMSADTFDPSGLLTRAQISKIIHTLRGV
ncbi:MAG: S-layer homology domain-containing protein [Oscillospiraceae bacterium]|nr:S-layer homology domain-containing protein [Oscillospiraceae bacterium]